MSVCELYRRHECSIETENQRLRAENEKLKKQLKEGYHCASFEMCGGTGEKYEKQIAELKAELEKCQFAIREINCIREDELQAFTKPVGLLKYIHVITKPIILPEKEGE